jgi:arylsulfatase
LGASLKPGKHTIVFDFKLDGPGFGKGGTGVLSVDGKELSRQNGGAHDSVSDGDRRELRHRERYSHVGRRQLQAAVPLSGTINKLTFKLRQEQLTARIAKRSRKRWRRRETKDEGSNDTKRID